MAAAGNQTCYPSKACTERLEKHYDKVNMEAGRAFSAGRNWAFHLVGFKKSPLINYFCLEQKSIGFF